jgi:hypothetical protein
MRFSTQSLLVAAILALTVAEASARGWGGWGGWGGGGHGVPGPIAGAGLGYLAVIGGGYWLSRLWRKHKDSE